MLYCSLHDENKSHTTRERKILRTKDREKNKHQTKDYKRNFKEEKHLEKESAHQRAKYLKDKNLNKYFAKKNTSKEETVILDETSDSDSFSSSEAQNSRNKD